jgi:hypothetical protein
MTMWNSWRQGPKQLSELRSIGIAYFVLDELGDKIDGPFTDEEDARTFMLSLPDGEFQIAQEYWGPSVDMLDYSNDGTSNAPEGPLTKLVYRLSVVGRICKAITLLFRTTSTNNGRTDEPYNAVYNTLGYATRMQSCGLWPSPSYYLDDDNAAWLRLPTHDNS